MKGKSGGIPKMKATPIINGAKAKTFGRPATGAGLSKLAGPSATKVTKVK